MLRKGDFAMIEAVHEHGVDKKGNAADWKCIPRR